MNRFKTAAIALLILCFAASSQVRASAETVAAPPQEKRVEYPALPKEHWAYAALELLNLRAYEIVEGRPAGLYDGSYPMTRYEFAVAIARGLYKIGSRLDKPPSSEIPRFLFLEINGRRLEQMDALTALCTEFRVELERLGLTNSKWQLQ